MPIFLRQLSLIKLLVILSVCLLAYLYIDTAPLPTRTDLKPNPEQSSDTMLGKTAHNARQDIKKHKKPGAKKVKPASIETMGDPTTLNKAARVLGIDDNQYQAMKEDYFCDLAKTAWENCELQQTSDENLELCLKMGGYYTNSRHCGYQP